VKAEDAVVQAQLRDANEVGLLVEFYLLPFKRFRIGILLPNNKFPRGGGGGVPLGGGGLPVFVPMDGGSLAGCNAVYESSAAHETILVWNPRLNNPA